jgi:hypothetical protein
MVKAGADPTRSISVANRMISAAQLASAPSDLAAKIKVPTNDTNQEEYYVRVCCNNRRSFCNTNGF